MTPLTLAQTYILEHFEKETLAFHILRARLNFSATAEVTQAQLLSKNHNSSNEPGFVFHIIC